MYLIFAVTANVQGEKIVHLVLLRNCCLRRLVFGDLLYFVPSGTIKFYKVQAHNTIMPGILEIYIHKIFVVLYSNNFYNATDL